MPILGVMLGERGELLGRDLPLFSLAVSLSLVTFPSLRSRFDIVISDLSSYPAHLVIATTN